MNRGFTLVEIMIVMAIIAILSVLGFSSYEGAKRAARDGRRKADLETIRGAFERYYADNKVYPKNSSIFWECGQTFNGPEGSAFASTPYLKIPCDPLYESSSGYHYQFSGNDGFSYTLGAILENENASVCFSANCGPGKQCNYCITNP